MTGTRTEGVSDEYLHEALQLAGEIEMLTDPGDKNWDLAQYTQTIIQEVNRLRCRVAFLEGWKEGVEPFVAKQRPRPPACRNTVDETHASEALKKRILRRNGGSPADETRQAAEDRLNRT